MSDYNRLISYVYMYHEGEKRKNVGFVKLESRNGQCKIGISLKGIHIGNEDLDVFLFSFKKKIPVGKIYIRNGQGELRIVTEQENLVGSGEALESMGGLRIESQTAYNTYYATIWDDELAEGRNENAADLNLHAAQLETNQAIEEQADKSAVAANIKVSAEAKPKTEIKSEKMVRTEESAKIEAEEVSGQSENATVETTVETEIPLMEVGLKPESEPAVEAVAQPGFLTEAEVAMESETEGELSAEWAGGFQPEMPISMWDHLTMQFPKTQCFAADKPHEILAIQPQDIGVLPRDVWIYGNNSFLLHGYYQYRYLILVKMQMDEERVKYLLGVPGIYHNNERFMATMFGFSNFYLAKRQSPKMGQFGYWCAEIQLV